MDIKQFKEYIFNNNYIEIILNELSMHKIKWHDNRRYITCAFPDGDNPNGCVVYNNENLNVISYTRDLNNNYTDIITLIEFINKISFFEAIKWICH